MMNRLRSSRFRLYVIYCYLALCCQLISSLKHHLVLTNDHRYQVTVSSFGYNVNGRLEVIVRNLTLSPDPAEGSASPHYGFVLFKSDQARNPNAARPVRQDPKSTCLLQDPENQFKIDLMTLIVLPMENKVLVRCTGDRSIFPPIKSLTYDPKRLSSSPNSSYIHTYNKRAAGAVIPSNAQYQPLDSQDILPERKNKNENDSLSPLYHKCYNSPEYLPLEIVLDDSGRKLYSFNFSMIVTNEDEEANYFLSFHNCGGFRFYNNYQHEGPHSTEFDEFGGYTITRFNLDMLIFETNYPENYLSAGAMPLPQMYFMLSVMFFLSGCVWVNFIRRHKENTLKIHNLMTVLVFAKACSLLFHGINYHYIAMYGQPVVTWAYLYYATRSVKGALFFITLALIGSGWTFIKHILSPNDKKILIVIIAAQVIAHIAEIVLDESLEGQASIEFWAGLCSIVDFFSCVVILVSISNSMKHLEDASSTDGKAAMNLKKFKLFGRFYIVSTVYIYATRIITFSVLSMLVFKYSWLAEVFSELATLAYFIVTGYFFQPIPTNPYLLLSTENDQEEDILFSVDAHEMNGIRMVDHDPQHDRNALLGDEDNSKTKVPRRVVEDFV